MKVIMDEATIKMATKRITQEILDSGSELSDLLIVGIKTRGEFVAKRVSYYLRLLAGVSVPWCSFDISCFRDDIDTKNISPEQLTMTVTNRSIILVDDVLFTGRTVRAAIDGIIANGRPKSIQLAVLVDRGHRELPFKADYIGKNIPTDYADRIIVKLKEYDGEDVVYLRTNDEPPSHRR